MWIRNFHVIPITTRVLMIYIGDFQRFVIG